MTKKHSTPLTAEQLLNDDQFVRAVLEGRSSVEAYHQTHLRQFGDIANVVEDARATILSMQRHFKAQSPSQKTLATTLERIRSS
ncbi:hypothetical protein [Phaeodactylibacter xiamenensis]|uniref:hypothetical protein n=1 Tax=Phaeodactylibacter xiamenensis TaxID=1524460 RepID=UPI0024A97FE8|nr:hypothetical protein [Phaeodactylibacter xiamenensis]